MWCYGAHKGGETRTIVFFIGIAQVELLQNKIIGAEQQRNSTLEKIELVDEYLRLREDNNFKVEQPCHLPSNPMISYEYFFGFDPTWAPLLKVHESTHDTTGRPVSHSFFA